MTWFKVDDQFHDHKKVRRLGKDRLPAAGLWSLCGSWAADNLTDGFVPTEVVQRSDPTEQYARRLVEVGFWEIAEQDGEAGYQFHDWDDHQPTRAEVLERRERRAAAGRLGGRASAESRARARAEASASPHGPAHGEALAQANGKQSSTPSRPVPSRSSSSDSLSPANAIAGALGLKTDDDETTKILELIKAENRPTALGPYVRTLAANGDLDDYLDRVRRHVTESRASPTAAYTGPTHEFEPSATRGDPSCARPGCNRPRQHACHRHPEAEPDAP